MTTHRELIKAILELLEEKSPVLFQDVLYKKGWEKKERRD